MNDKTERWSETFNQALQERGLFVRDYDDAGKVQPYTAADAVHRMLCAFDLQRREPWMALTLGEFADVFGESMDIRRFIGEEAWEPNVCAVQGKLRKEEAAQAERIQELEDKLSRLQGIIGDLSALLGEKRGLRHSRHDGGS